MTLEEFLDKVCQRPLPQNPMARVRTLAKELAEGAAEEIWPPEILEHSFNEKYENVAALLTKNFDYFRSKYALHSDDENALRQALLSECTKLTSALKNMGIYIVTRWGLTYPSLDLLVITNYVSVTRSTPFGILRITDIAFALLEETEPSTIFISYKRSESSAFALLVLKYLEEAGLKPFLDVALVPGEDWHDGLKERIQAQDYFLLLLGRTTLESPFVIKEISWALEKGMTLLPIWQPGFEFIADAWPDLPDPIPHKLANTHTIRVQEENPLAYNTAMDELLNRFGITP